MRLSRLDLELFGHFRGAHLELPPGLAVVHGDNEAGKTTVLESIRWLLFGHKQADRFAIDVEPTSLAVSAKVELTRGRLLDIRRSKGRGGGLRGATASGDDVDEEWIHAQLSRPNRAVFENVFGFSLEGLARGADALAHEELKSAVYGGGLGGNVHPDAILAELRGEAEKLFAEKGKQRRLNVLKAEIDSLEKRVRLATMRTSEWDRRRDHLEERERVVREKLEALRARREERDGLARRLQAVEPLRARDAAQTELADLSVPEGLPLDAATRRERLASRRASLVEQLEELDQLAERSRDALLRIEVDEAVLAERTVIASLVRREERHARARDDLPRLLAELDSLTAGVRERLSELRPDWGLDRLRALELDAGTRADLESTFARHESLVAEEAAIETRVREVETDIAAAERRLSQLPAPSDVAPLRAWLDAWSGAAAQRDEARRSETQLRALARRVDAARRKLDPPLAPALDAASLVVPRREEIEALARDLAARETDRARVGEQLAAIDAELAQIERSLVEAGAEGAVPNDADLRALRARRDEIWDDVVRALHGEPVRDKPHVLATTYERARAAADQAVDRMRDRADAVQRRAHAEARRSTALEQRARLVARRDEIDAAIAALLARHAEAWARAGLSPLAPAAMRAWLDDRETYLALEAEHAAAHERREDLLRAVEAFVRRGRELLGRDGGDLDELRADALRIVNESEARARERETLERQLARDRERLTREHEAREATAREREAWSQRYAKTLAVVGLPAGASVAAAKAVVSGLADLRQELTLRERDLRRRIESLQTEVREFDEEVAAIATRLGAPADARALGERLEAAQRAATERDEARRALEQATSRAAPLVRERDRIDAALAELHSLAGEDDEEGFRRIAERRERAALLRREIELQSAALARLQVRDDEHASIVALDVDRTRLRIAELDAEIASLEREGADANQALGAARTSFQEIDGRGDAAEAQALLEIERAALRDAVERYAVLALAESILRSAITRFEREHQPELLDRASRLFRNMTLGRYLAVRKSGQGLLCERDDGREIAPDKLSTGTAEQLYLAIRLAYIELYCAGAEPLPVVLDDVLVNFDDRRARATLEALAQFANTTQVLLFTCHRTTIALASEAGIGAATLAIPAPRA